MRRGKPTAEALKQCNKCGHIKELSDFYSCKTTVDRHRPECKKCRKIYAQAWRKAKPNHNDIRKRWRSENRDKEKAIWDRANAKASQSIKKRLGHCMRSRMNQSLIKGAKAYRHWELLVGYTIDQLKSHLERKFTPEMTWENHGTYWHIDHIVPVAAFNYFTPDDIDFKKCWSLRNLQPLESMTNFRKSARIKTPFQPSLAIA